MGKTTLLNGMAGYNGVTGIDFAGVTSWEMVEVKNGSRLANGKCLRVLDTPGLGGPKGLLAEWLRNMLDVLTKHAKRVGAIVILIDGIICRLTMASHIMTQIVPALLNEEKNPWDRICIVVSKCNVPNSMYQKLGAKATRTQVQNGLVNTRCPRVDAFNLERDIIFCWMCYSTVGAARTCGCRC